ncbi:MAG: ATP-dependent DNA helicase RecG, partial [Sphingobacterium sp.]
MELVWFQSLSWLRKGLKVGSAYIIYGKPAVFNGVVSITHPEMELYNPQAKAPGNMRMQPVYSSTEKLKKFNLDTKGFQRLQQAALASCLSAIEETLPSYIIQKFNLMGYREALINVHFPQNEALAHAARERLKFDELLFIQLRLLRNKQLNTQKYKGHYLAQVGDKFNRFYKDHLPFSLTGA